MEGRVFDRLASTSLSLQGEEDVKGPVTYSFLLLWRYFQKI